MESSVPLSETVCSSGAQCSHSDCWRPGSDWRRHNARTRAPALRVIRVLSILANAAG